MLKNKVIIVLFFMFCVKNINADVPFVIEIDNVTINGGTIYVGIFFSEESYKKNKPERLFEIEPSHTTVRLDLQMTEGEYVIGIHQDSNGNGEMDYGVFGIPKEPYGLSNMTGKIPGNYNTLRFRVNGRNDKMIAPFVRF
ncbi:MAG: DUF2141 domain-containing protein [Treponema sp.]|nr:DUF2141 domain-containing protein [Treponema sp.]